MKKKPVRVSFEQLTDMLQEKWESGSLTNDKESINNFAKTGLLPIGLIRERLKWTIQRAEKGKGFWLTYNDEEEAI